MHLYNAWLPPPVALEAKREKESFGLVVRSVRDSWRSDDPESVYASLKWISVIDLFIKAKSDISLEDVEELVVLGLRFFHASQNKLYAQVRWGNLLVKLLNKYRKKLSLDVQWRPFYDNLLKTHFSRNTGPEGWRLRQRHFETVTSLIRSCRKFFPSGSASEVWLEFRPSLGNPWHNSCFEGSGFLRLFLPTNSVNEDFFSHNWINQCIDIWNSIPKCQFWDSQWAAIIARCIKSYALFDWWEHFLPLLYTRFLNMFEVPVSSGNGSYPFCVDVPRNTRFLFSNKAVVPSKAVAKSIVYLLKPGSLAQEYLEKLVDLLEQYYHPSNGGRWTYALERFLRYLVITFQKRLQQEQLNANGNGSEKIFLRKSEIVSFVKVVLKLIDRGQYSKNDSLAETVAAATSILSYVEPLVVLPFIASRFHMALETMTATHQLTTAVTSVAFAGRALFLASFSSSFRTADAGSSDAFGNLLMISLSNALLGLDANDPPKTLATMQLIGSIFSNIASLDDNNNVLPFLPSISFSEWLDEFLCRLFTLFQNLEPNSIINEGTPPSSTSGTFLVEDGHFFFCMLEILLGKLSKPLFSQALKKISKFVQTNVLPGAIAEVGLLCCACVHSCPEEAAVHLIQPILFSILSSLQGSPVTGFGGTGITNDLLSNKAKLALSPALEIAVDYQLKILSLTISYAGPVLLCCKDLLKEAITAAFNAPSWKVNVGGDHVLRSLFGSLVLYYPIDQYKCHSDGTLLEEWISAKAYQSEQMTSPLWHLPSEDEVSFANELLNLHFCSALDDLLLICQTKIHSEPGIEKEHLKVTLLRIESTLQGVQSCLPDFHASFGNGVFNDLGSSSFLIAGAIGSTVGSSELRAKAVEIIHVACKYLLEERPDDSILLILVIRIMDALGNYGSLEYDEWSNHRQAWKLESAAIIEPPINFIVASHSQGKKRPRWALIDKVCMHNTWRSSQSSYHLFRTSTGLSPSDHVCLLMDDLLRLSLCNYETVRIVAGKSLLKILKRWSSMISKCVLTLTEKLQNSNSHEHEVLGSCALLSTQMVIKHLTVDRKSFSSFLLGVLASYHHESLKSQKAINELFVKFNIHFTGVSRSILKKSQNRSDESEFTDLVVEIGSMSVDTTGLHWRYNLMANRILLLLTMASMSDPDSSSDILSTTAAHFLKNLRSQLPQTRMLSVSALNTLLKESPHKIFDRELHPISEDFKGNEKSSLEGALSQIFCEEGFFSDTMNSLSHVHIITDIESTSSRGTHGASSFQSLADKSITHFYFDFSASWPRTPSWISILGNDTFYAHFARIFKRLVQECGMPILLAFQCSLEQFSNAKERSKQCVAAEALAGVLHSDVTGLVEAWDSWIKVLLQKVILAPSVDSIPEWAASIRYAVTGKGKYGTRAPILRQRILDCLVAPLPQVVATNVVAKRYTFLSAALIEVSPNRMQRQEVELHEELLEELMSNMIHSSAQVREVIGVALSVLCSNIRLRESFIQSICDKGETKADDLTGRQNWGQDLTQRASELAVNIQNTLQSGHSEFQGNKTYIREHSNNESQDVKWMETMFHFIISSLKSGRSSALLDIMVGLLYPAISLQETSNKDLSALAKASFELLKWRIFPVPHLQQAVSVLLSSSNDCNWRTRYATLTYLRTFLYRHTFIMSRMEKQQIWETIEKLLKDNQVEVREHAAAVLAALMKGGDEDLARDFRDRAIKEATSIQKRRRKRNSSTGDSVPSVHGTVLALAASVLSVPYDMPSWLPDQVTLLARFIHEPSPVRSTVMKAVAEFRRTHADTWSVQKDSFSEEQLEVLADTSSSASYFA